jgi:hypothetical protein
MSLVDQDAIGRLDRDMDIGLAARQSIEGDHGIAQFIATLTQHATDAIVDVPTRNQASVMLLRHTIAR